MKFILASSSPRRQMLIKRLNIPFDVIPPNVDESLVLPDGNPEKYCTKLAELKANDISQHYTDELVISADTIVVIDSEIFGKPSDEMSAKYMLKTLSGNTHQVYTGVCIQSVSQGINQLFSEITSVSFQILDDKEIMHYIKSCSPYDKAGSYGIQDWSAVFIKEIRGCYDNVVGFPISRFYQEIKKLNINLLFSNSESS